MLIDPIRPPPAQRVLGVDPGAPKAWWAVAERVEKPGDGPEARICEYGSVEWRGRLEAWEEIRALVRGVDLVVCEGQFLNMAYFRREGRNPGAAGSYFANLVELAHVCMVFGCASMVELGRSAVSVMPGPWRRLLAPMPRKSRDEARGSSLRLIRATGLPGPGTRPAGAWRKCDHDIAAAACIALWGLGLKSGAGAVLGAWPPAA